METATAIVDLCCLRSQVCMASAGGHMNLYTLHTARNSAVLFFASGLAFRWCYRMRDEFAVPADMSSQGRLETWLERTSRDTPGGEKILYRYKQHGEFLNLFSVSLIHKRF